jgi:hypothetical protein
MNYIQEINSFQNWLILNPSVTSDDISLWYALMSLNNISGWQKEFTVAISTIRDRSRLSRSAIYRSRNRLVQLGRIRTKERSGNESSIYEIIPLSTNQNYFPVFQDGTQSGTHNGTHNGTQRGTQPGTIIKTKQDEKKLLDINISFESFWDAYEKRTGSKKKLEAKWEKLSDQDREAIMAYIPLYKVAQPAKQFRKNPETFLNNRSWEDEIIDSNNKNGNGKANRQNHAYQPITTGTAEGSGKL